MSLEWIKRKYTERVIKRKISVLRAKSKLPIVVFICTPIHGNLGDQAIVYAQYNFFEAIGLKNRILEITDPDYYRIKNKLPQYLNEKDIIIIDGGGNMGSLWPREDDIIREIILTYSKNKIFIFPQTVFYSKDSEAEIRMKNMKLALDNAANLFLFCRDIDTFNFAKNIYEVNAFLVPDIVMTLRNIKINSINKKGVLLCLRDDRECVCIDDGKKELIRFLEKENIPVIYSSTVVNSICRGNKNRKVALYEKWSEFANAEIVITDRLHGMIFSAILGIPCLAFDNKSHKVFNGYSWLIDLPYVKIASNGIEAIDLFKMLYQSKSKHSYINKKVDLEFQKMKELVKNEIG